MKTFFSKTNILIWVVLLLLVLNVAVIATIFYTRYRQHKILMRPPAELFKHNERPGLYLRNELGFTEEQFTGLSAVRMNYQKAVSEINIQIDEKRNEYWNELMKKNPDTKTLALFADSIGAWHAKLINETGNYYSSIRKLCNDKQLQNLNTFFMQTIQVNNNSMMHQRGMKMPMRPVNRMRNMRNYK
jgi:hypothetical protein